MGYYKIKNITPQLGKRHHKLNTTQIIEITNNFKTEKISVAPNSEFLLETNFLPIALHKLRSEGLVSIVELDKNTYHKVVNEQESAKKKSISQSQPQLTENKPVEPTEAEDRGKKYYQKNSKKDK